MNKKLRWPEDYETWTGGFDDLVATSTHILNEVCPEIGAPTTSLVRYYQQQGAVGRGKREGRGSTFSFTELAQIVASKQMVSQQVPLSIAKEVMSNASIETIYGNESVSHAYHSLANTPAAAASTVMLRSISKKANTAEQLVAKLMSQSGAPKHAMLNATSMVMGTPLTSITGGLPLSSLGVPQACQLPTPPSGGVGVLRYSLPNGVSVEIPADRHDRQLQAQTLREFADQLNPPHTTWSQP